MLNTWLRLNGERFLLAEGEQKWPARLLRVLLYPLAFVYGILQRTRVSLYDHKILVRRRLPCPVISIGNLTVGGSGKTPFALWLARLIRDNSVKIAVLTRGYGRKGKTSHMLVCSGEDSMRDTEECGDEPYLMASSLESVPVLVGKDRYATGQYALTHFGTEALLLDDGFQYLTLDRTLDIVLLPRDQDLSASSLIPRGVLREPLCALDRADIIIFTGLWTECHNGHDVYRDDTWVRQWNQRAPIFHASLIPEYLYEVAPNNKVPLEDQQGKQILAFCGIARPARFLMTLEKLGISIASHLIFPDHHRYTPNDIAAIKERLCSMDCAITTEKDAVKLRQYVWPEGKLLALKVSMVIKEEEAFGRILFERMNYPHRSSKQ